MYIVTDEIVKNDFLEGIMREMSFEELMRTSVNVTSVSAVEQYWKDGNLNLHHEEGRLENVLSYTIEGSREISALPCWQKEPGAKERPAPRCLCMPK